MDRCRSFSERLGSAIGQSFDGTTVPLTAGFALCGAMSMLILLATERGRLYQRL